jgi:hypothetical protein
LSPSYWIDNLGFITEGKLAAIFIKPSLGVSNWPVIYYTQSSFLASSSPRHHGPLLESVVVVSRGNGTKVVGVHGVLRPVEKLPLPLFRRPCTSLSALQAKWNK